MPDIDYTGALDFLGWWSGTLGWFLLPFIILKAAVLIIGAGLHVRRNRWRTAVSDGPTMSILVPCYNEEKTLKNVVESLLELEYDGGFEIIIIDDGSTDDTHRVGRRLAMANAGAVFFTRQENAGKAVALNRGLARARGEVVCTVDADSVLSKDCLQWLAPYYDDPDVVGVGGNVKVANRHSVMSKHQALEYVIGLNLQRRMFAYLGALQVTSGALGSFRRTALEDIGGFPEETIVEDMDVTVTLGLAGGKVEFEPRALAYTEAPQTFAGWKKQRLRWTWGGLKVCAKHKEALFRKNRMGRIGLPFFLIFPWFDVMVTLIFVATVIRALMLGSVAPMLAIYVALAFVSVATAIQAFRYDGHGEPRRLAFLAIADGLWYFHLATLMTMWAAWAFLTGAQVGWNKLDRLGLNTLPNDAVDDQARAEVA